MYDKYVLLIIIGTFTIILPDVISEEWIALIFPNDENRCHTELSCRSYEAVSKLANENQNSKVW